MTLIVPDGFASVIHSLQLSGDPEPYAITYGVSTAVTSPTDAATLAQQLHTAYASNINPTNPSVLTLNQTEVKVSAAGEPFPVVGTYSVPAAGAGGSTALVPQNTALLVHKRTGHGGRPGRGRMYFPALNEANVDLIGQITSAWLSTMNTALAAWLSAINATALSGPMVLLHDSGGAGAALVPYEVTSLAADPIAASQRRRLRH